MTDLNTLSIVQLTSLYNKLARTPVAKFRDKGTAVRRLQYELDGAGLFVNEEMGLSELPPGPDKHRTPQANQEAPGVEPEPKDKPMPETKQEKPRGRASNFSGKLIRATKESQEANPRRQGSAGYKSMEIVRSKPGLSYEEFISRGGRSKDLAWDLQHGNVVLS